jgi:hypothetical protein
VNFNNPVSFASKPLNTLKLNVSFKDNHGPLVLPLPWTGKRRWGVTWTLCVVLSSARVSNLTDRRIWRIDWLLFVCGRLFMRKLSEARTIACEWTFSILEPRFMAASEKENLTMSHVTSHFKIKFHVWTDKCVPTRHGFAGKVSFSPCMRSKKDSEIKIDLHKTELPNDYDTAMSDTA